MYLGFYYSHDTEFSPANLFSMEAFIKKNSLKPSPHKNAPVFFQSIADQSKIPRKHERIVFTRKFVHRSLDWNANQIINLAASLHGKEKR